MYKIYKTKRDEGVVGCWKAPGLDIHTINAGRRQAAIVRHQRIKVSRA